MKPWSEVADSTAFGELSPLQQESARQQYFNSVIAPKAPPNKLGEVQAQFDSDTQDDTPQKLLTALTVPESGGNPNAVGPDVGNGRGSAQGSVQIMRATFNEFAKPGENFGNDADRRKVALRKIWSDYDHFSGDSEKTAAAYIGGRGAVRDDGSIRDDVADANGTTPQAYASQVMSIMNSLPGRKAPGYAKIYDPSVDGIGAGAGRGTVNPSLPDSSNPTTMAAADLQAPLGDPMGSGAAEIANPGQPLTGSVFDTRKMDAPTNDANANQLAMEKSVSPDSVMFNTGRGLQQANAQVAKGAVREARANVPPPTSGSTAQDVAINALAGAAGQVAGAGAAIADATGADNVAQSLDAAHEYWQQQSKANGGETIPGKLANFVGAIAPAFLVPASDAFQLVGNASLFAIPAFRDTLKTQLERTDNFPLALAHASQAFGINLFLPQVATKGIGAASTVLGVGEAAGLKGIATSLGQGAAEGAAFSAVNTVSDKATDLAAGQKNDADWINFADMGVMATGIPMLRAGHMIPHAVDATVSRFGTREQQFSHALDQDVANRDFEPIQPDLNPNLAAVQKSTIASGEVDPIARITQAGSVDEAIAAAQDAVGKSSDSVAEQMLKIRPLETPNVSDALDPDAALRASTGERGADNAGSERPGDVLDRSAGERVDTLPAEPAIGSGAADVLRDAGDQPAAVAQAHVINRNPDGTITVKGDPAAVRQTLKDAGVTSMVPRRDGILVSKSQADLAQRAIEAKVLADPIATHDSQVANLGQSAEDNLSGQTPMFSREKTEPFYSALSRGIDGINAKAQPSEGWRSQIQGLVAKGAVKADEVEWSGVSDWLKLQQGKVSKQAVQDFLDGNGVKVTETMLGHEEPVAISDAEHAEYSKLDGMDENGVLPEHLRARYKELGARVTAAMNASDRNYKRETKFGNYTLPGGENYRELLLTLPIHQEAAQESLARQEYGDTFQNLSADDQQHVRNMVASRSKEGNFDFGKEYKAAAYRSNHWHQPNVLAHIRFNDRTDSEGKKVLFIEELQSDWGQEGKKKGFKQKNPLPAATESDIDLRRIERDPGDDPEIYPGYWESFDKRTGALITRHGGRMDRSAAMREAIQYGHYDAEARAKDGTPSAPFVGKTDAWVSLALKRMIKYAVDNGYDRVALVNGEQSAARYDLSKQVDAVRAVHAGGKDTSVVDLQVKHKGQQDWDTVQTGVKESAVEDYVGKDAAKKLLDQPRDSSGNREISGLDLKVGGAGMIAFYDKIVPSVAKDVLKKLGGDGLTTFQMQTSKGPLVHQQEGGFKREPSTTAQPGFDITPAMKARAADGVPMFKRTDSTPTKVNEAHHAQVEQHVEAIRSKWKNAPDTIVLRDMNDPRVPEKVAEANNSQTENGADSQVNGFFYGGKVYVVSSAMKTRGDVITVMAHEGLGHFGFRVFGDALDGIKAQVVAMRPSEVLAKGKDYGLPVTTELARKALGPQATDAEVKRIVKSARLYAAEEVLANIAQTNPQATIVQRAIGAIRAWLKDMGVKMEMTDNDIITQYILPARNWVLRGSDAGKPGEMPQFMRAYHGSPHDFDKFSTDKIGTGEGAQAYGHGLYFAEDEGVAKGYHKTLTQVDTDVLPDSVMSAMKASLNSLPKDVRNDGQGVLDQFERASHAYNVIQDVNKYGEPEVAAWMNKHIDAAAKKGGLYQVDIPDHVVDKMLHWDKPLSEQPELRAKVYGNSWQHALRDISSTKNVGDFKGADLYRALSDKEGGDRQASETLESAGIPGIKYLDNGSRNAGGWKITPPNQTASGKWMVKSSDYNSKGLHFDTEAEAKTALAEKIAGETHNLVVFNDKNVTLTHKDGTPITKDERAEYLKQEAVPQFSRGTTDDMANRKDVVGKSQGGRSADDKTTGAQPKVWFHGSPYRIAGGFDLSKFGSGAFENLRRGSEGYVPATYLTNSEAHARSFGDEIHRVQLDENNAIQFDAVKELNQWAKENGHKNAQAMVDNYYEGDVYDALGADSQFNQLAKKAVAEGKHVAIVDFGELTTVRGATRFKAGKVAIVVDPSKAKISNESTAPDSGGAHQFSRSKTADAADIPDETPERKPYDGPGAGMLEGAKGILHDIYMGLAPMSAGEQKPQAAAQQFMNDSRKARFQWQKLSMLVKEKFTPEERTQMWDAADEQNSLMLKGESTAGRGLETLNPQQRQVMQTLHQYANSLWSRAQETGMVTGDGLPFWTPRMAVMIGDDGSFTKPVGEGKQATSDGKGRNVFTTAPSAKHRTQDHLAESEAALKAKLGDNADYVHDILTMPLAMSRFEQAIAGRELINTIKEIGLASGKELVNSTGGPGFFTLDHPAFTSYRPRMVTDAEGKNVAAMDQNGEIIMDRKPMFIDKSFEGPLKAVMSTKDNKVYTGYMLAKSKAMTTIMYSPMIHNQVIFGRALGYAQTLEGGPLKTIGLYFSGHSAKKDPEFMQKMIHGGMVPIGEHNNMLDVGDLAAGGNFKEGGWMDPNESWIGLGVKAIGNKIVSGWGDKAKTGIDAAGDFWHNTLLWKRVGDLQAGIAKDAYDHLIARGFSDNVASIAAAHLSNRYAGAIGQENMSKYAHMTANVALFSKSFNAGNVGTVKDTAFGTTAGLRALIREEATNPLEAEKMLSFLKNKARFGLVKDLAYSIIALNLAQMWFKRDKNADWGVESVKHGISYETGIAMKAYMNWKAHPDALGSYNPYRLAGTSDNEPGKENRVFMGLQESGRGQYMRLPGGKVVEDLIGWTTDFAKTADAKKSPFIKALDVLRNKKDDFGTPIWDDRDPNFLHRAADAAMFLLGTHMPIDQIKTIKDMASGVATPLDKEKTTGNMTGLTISQGHPSGPEAGVAAEVEKSVKGSQQHAMEEVKRLLKYGKSDEAWNLLENSDLTPKEITRIIQKVQDPRGMISKSALKKFNQHATPEEHQRLEDVTQ